ncbi:BolA family transcriptional regulator [Skermanella stibiiresistens SB22]|uniref:BolA family transcriptional regulator n=1 Tax=Skermanella stibiiresistens SB22 TaxID=1385369 RepID=W9GXJ8_9PROT|nr:BolA family protein [Skermanella stibiiresistens]EWY37366.1 BolA family transcriptional regulator [Skermanella stibiiresistens SB22]
MDNATEYATRMRAKLTEALRPSRLEIEDDSRRHAGHAGAGAEGETHFNIIIVSDAFEGKSRVARQRQVYDIVADELRERVHALSLKTLTLAEDV